MEREKKKKKKKSGKGKEKRKRLSWPSTSASRGKKNGCKKKRKVKGEKEKKKGARDKRWGLPGCICMQQAIEQAQRSKGNEIQQRKPDKTTLTDRQNKGSQQQDKRPRDEGIGKRGREERDWLGIIMELMRFFWGTALYSP